MTMSRRQFLQLGAVGAVAGLTDAAYGVSADASYDLHALAQPDLLSLLGPDSVRAIGLRYREMVPAENQMKALHAAQWAPHRSVANLVREDFAQGRTILVQGWVLSVTEARQCALFSLLPF
jgi:hypothetical protein